MEDAAALGIVLQGVSSPREIEKRLDLYQDIRRNRASAIQILSNVGSDQCHLVHDDLKEFLAEPDIPRLGKIDLCVNMLRALASLCNVKDTDLKSTLILVAI
ncbi:hypothetical protein SLS62_006121 [Diatrype stigma]|uniref:Uncharacterized protein n=1 Tax=Diatrype stigma TaxID=117547 RepID=A0AAN9UQF1_9PEZI